MALLAGLIGTSLGLVAALKARGAALMARQKEKEQTELSEQRLYDVRMSQVQHYWEDRNLGLLSQELADQLPANQGGNDRRGFEWFYWQRKVAAGYVTFKGAPVGAFRAWRSAPTAGDSPPPVTLG